MSREIKFRGKRLDNGEWVYGYYWRDENWKHKITVVNDNSICFEVIPETLGQHSGLKDKNDKEIYEGDIIEKTYYSYHQPECSEIFKIIYNGLGFSFEHIKGRFYHTPFTEEIEVIGNIYEHPELLKGESR